MTLQLAFVRALLAFQTVFTIGQLNGESLWTEKKSKFRLGTMSLDSALDDICQCFITNAEKRTKRLARINMILQMYAGYQFSPATCQKLKTVFDMPIDDLEAVDEDEIALFRRLVSETESERKMIHGITVYETGTAFVPPVAKQIHGFCTKSVNQDGDVYNLMTKVATIVLHRLLMTSDDKTWSETSRKMLAGAQIIFKGGAALGTYLFKKSKVWARLTDEQKSAIEQSFILGGDNDTSLNFVNLKDLKKSVSADEINSSIFAISNKMNEILWNVCDEFQDDIMELLRVKINRLTDLQFEFAGQEFMFSEREATGFQMKFMDGGELQATKEAVDEDFDMIGDADKKFICFFNADKPKKTVFTTQSTVEFPSPLDNGKTVNFELVRAKLGFVAKGADITVNTYSELLDISVEYAHSDVLFNKEYVAIHLDA